MAAPLLNDHIRGVADRLAREGFTVFATDLYGGRVTKDSEEVLGSMGPGGALPLRRRPRVLQVDFLRAKLG